MGRNEQTSKKQNKNKERNETNKQTKTPCSGTIEFKFKFWSYSSIIQSWPWHISRRADMVSPGDWLVSSVLFFCLPV
jgi:hypothetical protein